MTLKFKKLKSTLLLNTQKMLEYVKYQGNQLSSPMFYNYYFIVHHFTINYYFTFDVNVCVYDTLYPDCLSANFKLYEKRKGKNLRTGVYSNINKQVFLYEEI